MLATGAPNLAGTGSVQWVTGLHPGTYTDIVKVDVDTTTVPGTTVSTVLFRIGIAEWAITVTDPGSGGPLAASEYFVRLTVALVNGQWTVTGAEDIGAVG